MPVQQFWIQAAGRPIVDYSEPEVNDDLIGRLLEHVHQRSVLGGYRENGAPTFTLLVNGEAVSVTVSTVTVISNSYNTIISISTPLMESRVVDMEAFSANNDPATTIPPPVYWMAELRIQFINGDFHQSMAWVTVHEER